jgi:3-hydroxyisobutyrate dehydrogenase-like beta-hydroxyacid dehydrogenase
MTIHWCGTGLSSIPGLRRLILAGHPVAVWNRTENKARDTVGDITTDIRIYSLDALEAAVTGGDIVVSMLPADQHVPLGAALRFSFDPTFFRAFRGAAMGGDQPL